MSEKTTSSDLIAVFSPALGEPRAREIVSSAIQTLGCGDVLDAEQVRAFYELVSQELGAVGRTARLAMRKHLASPRDEASQAPPSAPVSPRPIASEGKRLPCAEIFALFAPCMGDEKAADLVRATMRKLHLSGDALGKADVLRLLEALATEPGIVGVTARFAKARIILRFA